MGETELKKKFIRGCESIGGEPTKLTEDRFKCEVERHKVVFDRKLNEATLSEFFGGRLKFGEVIANIKPVENIEIKESFFPKKPLERVGKLEKSPSILRIESDDDWFSLRETRERRLEKKRREVIKEMGEGESPYEKRKSSFEELEEITGEYGDTEGGKGTELEEK